MSKPLSESETSLLSEAVLEAMVVNIESGNTIRRARDLLTDFREFHGWTLDKLQVLDTYLRVYRRVAGNGTFIDAFAGTGHGLSIRDGKPVRVDGSSLIAAKSGAFAHLYLVEKNPTHRQSLETSLQSLTARQQRRIHVLPGDCNIVIPELLESGRLDNQRPCFALLDQESTQLDWQTIETLAAWKSYIEPPAHENPKDCKVELWILFNSHQVLHRLWPQDRIRYPKSFSPQTLDRMFGGRDSWWDLWENYRPSSALTTRFADQLKELGYQYVFPQTIRDPSTGRPQYQMFHATDHPSAIEIMRWAKRSTDGFENVHLPGFGTTVDS